MGTWIWLVWIAAIFISFAIFEGYALKHGDRMWTLSRLVSTIGAKWPLSIALLGFLFGGLLVHFYWPYDNPLLHASLISSAVAAELPPMPKPGQVEGTINAWTAAWRAVKAAVDAGAWLLPWLSFFAAQGSAWFVWPNKVPALKLLAGNYRNAANAE
jgi:hypothetical protein